MPEPSVTLGPSLGVSVVRLILFRETSRVLLKLVKKKKSAVHTLQPIHKLIRFNLLSLVVDEQETLYEK